MSTQKEVPTRSYEDRVEHRFRRKATAVADRIQRLMGDMTQAALAERVGKGDSTVSDHLSGTVNVTLRTITEYESALDAAVVSVPDLERPKERRRRRDSGSRRVSEQRKAVQDIDPAKRRLHRLLTRVSARIGKLLDDDEECTQKDLADRLGKDPSYVSRVLGGGVNLTLKTIVRFEEAFGACILSVKGTPKGTFTGRHKTTAYVQLVQKTDDGCHFEDQEGKVTKGVTAHLESNEKEVTIADDPVMSYG